MITGAKVMYDQNNIKLGVVGADILISSINDVLHNVNFLETGKLTLFEISGQVVSDAEWDEDVQASSTKPFLFSDLLSPEVFQTTFDNLIDVGVGEQMTGTFRDWVAYSYHLEAHDNTYFLVVFVKSEVIFSDLDDANKSISIMLALITVCVSVFLIMVVLCIVNNILKTFSDMEQNVDALLSNVGCPEKNLAFGMVDTSVAHSAELHNMNTNMNCVIKNLRNVREDAQRNNLMQNYAYAQASFFTDLVSMHHPRVAVSSAPPVYAFEVEATAVTTSTSERPSTQL
jgi:hypothetical protein